MTADAPVYGWVLRTVLRRIDAETAHRLSFGALRALAAAPGAARLGQRLLGPRDPALRVEALGLRFPGPLGLAAGFDKDARGVDALAALGFAFVEIGTVTGQAQSGNPRPRLFRLLRDRAVLNRMGFNNDGSAAARRRLDGRSRRRHLDVVVGANIGKTKAVPDGEAVADYVASARALAPVADYLVVNVSSPNTPGLRDLQAVESLRPLLTAVRAEADAAAGRRVPLLVKIAPDLSDDDVLAVADLALELRLEGIVATNTTVSREGLETPSREVSELGSGGISGAVLRDRSLEVLRLLRSRVGDKLVLVSVGGIGSADDAWARIRAGATLVQGYTGLVYGGPLWPRRLHRGLAEHVHAAGFPSLQDAVGTEVRS